MKYADNPCLFQKSDTASLQQQNSYLVATKTEFVFVFLAALSGGFIPFGNEKACVACSVITAIALGMAFFVRLFIQIMKWDRKWFDTRAIAESVKTTTWRYVMAVEPYPQTTDPTRIDKKFVDELNEIFKARPEAHSAMATCLPSGDKQISDRMRAIRNLSINERKQIYLSQRVKDQRDWYRTKAKFNEETERRWTVLIMGSEAFGVAIAVALVFWSDVFFNPLGVITTLVAIFCAWVQIKKHRELSQSYAMAEQELTSIESLAHHVDTEDALMEYIVNTENAISREHTMWCAKRI